LIQCSDIVGRYDDRYAKEYSVSIGHNGPFGYPLLLHRVRGVTKTSSLDGEVTITYSKLQRIITGYKEIQKYGLSYPNLTLEKWGTISYNGL